VGKSHSGSAGYERVLYNFEARLCKAKKVSPINSKIDSFGKEGIKNSSAQIM
jgi:hypothetical protein